MAAVASDGTKTSTVGGRNGPSYSGQFRCPRALPRMHEIELPCSIVESVLPTVPSTAVQVGPIPFCLSAEASQRVLVQPNTWLLANDCPSLHPKRVLPIGLSERACTIHPSRC